ncbi:MAG: cytochrome c oxidase subunit 2 [Urechidicola sp.]|jgi:cytochrome c oxidase subunit 2|tara:strand:- start:688 stop:1977 length:1290 start_codon:yes stop_codon:yes gene_type:complete
MKFLIIIVIVLVIITAAQLMKVYEHSSRLRNKDEADVTEGETKFNAGMLLVFYLALMISSTYLFIVYGARPGLGPSASEHGVEIDYLYDVNWIILIIVYYLTQTLLFVFAIKYHQKKGRKAVFFSHSTKLELLWTVIPAVTLAGIIIAGLMVWNKITAMPENAQVIEIYAKQFDWTVRYSGEDNTLGNSNFKVIETNNPLGVVTSDLIDAKELAWKADIAKLEKTISEEGDLIPDAKLSEMKFKLERLNRQLIRLTPLRKVQTPQTDSAANDDVIVKELYLVKGEVYEFKFRSRDVIHSALFPHFRAQMNCVPGMTTRLSFKPTISTAEMRENPEVIAQYKKTNEKRAAEGREEVDFNYLLLCNKICGASHYNMQMNIVVVDTQAEFDIWYAKQKESKTFAQLAGLLEPEEITDSTIKEVIVTQEVAAD